MGGMKGAGSRWMSGVVSGVLRGVGGGDLEDLILGVLPHPALDHDTHPCQVLRREPRLTGQRGVFMGPVRAAMQLRAAPPVKMSPFSSPSWTDTRQAMMTVLISNDIAISIVGRYRCDLVIGGVALSQAAGGALCLCRFPRPPPPNQ